VTPKTGNLEKDFQSDKPKIVLDFKKETGNKSFRTSTGDEQKYWHNLLIH
jgi:hypothetical protein